MEPPVESPHERQAQEETPGWDEQRGPAEPGLVVDVGAAVVNLEHRSGVVEISKDKKYRMGSTIPYIQYITCRYNP